MRESDVAYWKESIGKVAGNGLGLVANFGGTAVGDIALVPGMNLKIP